MTTTPEGTGPETRDPKAGFAQTANKAQLLRARRRAARELLALMPAEEKRKAEEAARAEAKKKEGRNENGEAETGRGGEGKDEEGGASEWKDALRRARVLGVDPVNAEAWLRPPSYFIGLKIVAQTEMDAFVTSHYRWAEICLNMVPTILVMFIAFTAATHSEWTWGQSICWGGLCALPFMGGLFWLGRKRLSEYRYRVAELIAGRLKEAHEKAKAGEQSKTIYDVLKLAKELGKQLSSHKQNGAGKDGQAEGKSGESRKPGEPTSR